MNTLLLIILISLAVVLGIGCFVVVFIIGKISVKNNPRKGLVFVKNGSEVSKPYKATLSEKGKRGVSFLYSNRVVMVPRSYEEIYHKNKRMIFIKHLGQIIASPFANDTELSEAEKESLIYELCSGHIGADGMRALTGKGNLNAIVIGIVCLIIGAVAMFAFNSFQETMQVKQSAPITQEQPAQSDTGIKVIPANQ